MDPQATYDAYRTAIEEGELAIACQHRDAYNAWRARGGFPARIPGTLADVDYILPEPAEGQDYGRGTLAVNPEAEGSAEWHAWARGYDYAARTGGVYAEPLSGEWADQISLPDLLDGVASDLGMSSDLSDNAEEEGAICDAFELGYLTWQCGWRV